MLGVGGDACGGRSQRIYIVNNGTIRAVGTPQDLLQPAFNR